MWRSPSGAAEDRNFVASKVLKMVGKVAVALRDGRESQRRLPHPRGRRAARVAVALRGGRGSQLQAAVDADAHGCVAVALLGDRESQHHPRGGHYHRALRVAVALRGGRGSEPRLEPIVTATTAAWRPPSGAAEGRNVIVPEDMLKTPTVAVALRGGPGSQRRPGRRLRAHGERGGRPSGRPRIATPPPPDRAAARRRWRSPSAATEDRNATSPDLPQTLVNSATSAPPLPFSWSRNGAPGLRARHDFPPC